MSVLRCALVALALLSVGVASAPVTSLPGLNEPMPSAIDAGYITVDATNDRRLFYMFVESQRSPSTDPLMIWLTGGPGCSSMFAMFTEHGPFTLNFTANGTGLLVNPYTWTTEANIIYLESPAGVGFSTSNVTSDYTTGDRRTADDSYAFLQGFLARFPQFQSNPFWVIGESYGGHYVPELVQRIAHGNQQLKSQRRRAGAAGGIHINLQGLMAGNPWTDPVTEAFGVVENWWDRAIMSEATYTSIKKHCTYRDITFWIVNNVTAGGQMTSEVKRARWMNALKQLQADLKSPIGRKALNGWTGPNTECFNALYQASMIQFGAVDIEGVYFDVCNAGTRGDIPDQPNWCGANQMQTYLNLPEVQAAIHVTAPFPPAWYSCSPWVSYSTPDTQNSVTYIYKAIIGSYGKPGPSMYGNMSVLVYSGDNDAIVPYTGTRKWLRTLNLTIVEDTHEWYSMTNGQQVAGWAVNYAEGLTFSTVRAAGHMVPFAQPKRALDLFHNFLANRKL